MHVDRFGLLPQAPVELGEMAFVTIMPGSNSHR
jgi:hypothetical protein